jgi:hypothetical protein
VSLNIKRQFSGEFCQDVQLFPSSIGRRSGMLALPTWQSWTNRSNLFFSFNDRTTFESEMTHRIAVQNSLFSMGHCPGRYEVAQSRNQLYSARAVVTPVSHHAALFSQCTKAFPLV